MRVKTPPGRRLGQSRLAQRLARETAGEVLFDAASRGRYATDASLYQIEPIGVLVPSRADDVVAALAIAGEEGVPVLPRGAGTSQSRICSSISALSLSRTHSRARVTSGSARSSARATCSRAACANPAAGSASPAS